MGRTEIGFLDRILVNNENAVDVSMGLVRDIIEDRIKDCMDCIKFWIRTQVSSALSVYFYADYCGILELHMKNTKDSTKGIHFFSRGLV